MKCAVTGARNVPTDNRSRGGNYVCASGYCPPVDNDEKHRYAARIRAAPKETHWDYFCERHASLPFVPMILPPQYSARPVMRFLMSAKITTKTPPELHHAPSTPPPPPATCPSTPATRHPVLRLVLHCAPREGGSPCPSKPSGRSWVGEGRWQLVTRLSALFPPCFCAKTK